MDLPDLPENTVAAFAALCGATVVITKKPDQEHAAYTWSCLGCGDYLPNGNSQFHVIAEANHHAGICRSVPLPSA